MLHKSHLKIIITISILLICILLIKYRESFSNKKEIKDNTKIEFINKIHDFHNQPKINLNQIRIFRIYNSKKIIIENFVQLKKINEFIYKKNYTFNKNSLFNQNKPLVNINSVFSSYLVSKPLKGNKENKKTGFCIKLKDNIDISNSIAEFTIRFTNDIYKEQVSKLLAIKHKVKQTKYRKQQRRSVHVFTKYNCPEDILPYFQKGDDNKEVGVVVKFLTSGNLDFISKFPNKKFNILDSNNNPILTGCELDVPFCNINLEKNEFIQGRNEIIAGKFNQDLQKFVVVDSDEYTEYKGEQRNNFKEEKIIQITEKLNNLFNKTSILLTEDIIDLSKLSDKEVIEFREYLPTRYEEIILSNKQYYINNKLLEIPEKTYARFLSFDRNIIINNNFKVKEGFSSIIKKAEEKFNKMNNFFNNNIENFEAEEPSFKGNKYISYTSFEECKKLENKEKHIKKFINNEFTSIEENNPIIKNKIDTINKIKNLSGIKCRKHYNSDIDKFYYGGIDENGFTKCAGDDGKCIMYETLDECNNDNPETFQDYNPNVLDVDCKNYYICEKIKAIKDIIKTKKLSNSDVTNNEELQTNGLYFTLHTNYTIKIKFKILKTPDGPGIDYLLNDSNSWFYHNFGLIFKNKNSISNNPLAESFITTNELVKKFGISLDLIKNKSIYGLELHKLTFSSPTYKSLKTNSFNGYLDKKDYILQNYDETQPMNQNIYQKMNEIIILTYRTQASHNNLDNVLTEYKIEDNEDATIQKSINVIQEDLWNGFNSNRDHTSDDILEELAKNYIFNINEEYDFEIQVYEDTTSVFINGEKISYKTNKKKYRKIENEIEIKYLNPDIFSIIDFEYIKQNHENYDCSKQICEYLKKEINNDGTNQKFKFTSLSKLNNTFFKPEKSCEHFSNMRMIKYDDLDEDLKKLNFMNCYYNIKDDVTCKHIDIIKDFDYKNKDFKIISRNLVDIITFKNCNQSNLINIISEHQNLEISPELDDKINKNIKENNLSDFIKDDITKFELNKPLDYVIQPCDEEYIDINSSLIFESVNIKFRIKKDINSNNLLLEILRNNISLGFLQNNNSNYKLNPGDYVLIYIDDSKNINIQVVGEESAKSSIKSININNNSINDEMNLILRTNNKNFIDNIYELEQLKQKSYPYDPFINISS